MSLEDASIRLHEHQISMLKSAGQMTTCSEAGLYFDRQALVVICHDNVDSSTNVRHIV